MTNKFSIRARLRSFKYAFTGLLFITKYEHNFRIHLLAALLVTCSGFYFNISVNDWLWVILAIGLVLSAEIFNSAIEKFVDLERPDHDPKAGLIKDLAAAGVLVAAITAAVIGLLIFWPYIKTSL